MTAKHHYWERRSISAIGAAGASNCAPPNAQKVRARHCCQAPPAPSEGFAGVRQLLDPKANRSSILAHQLRLPLPRTASPIRRSVRRPRLRPFLGHPLIASCFARRIPRNALVPHRARDKYLFRRLFPAGPEDHPRAIDIAGRRRSVLLSLPPRRASPERVSWLGDWDVRPDHPWNMTRSSESQKRNRMHLACG
jgi:hypothetical protein